MPHTRTRKELEAFLELAQKRYREVYDLESDQRAKELADLQFESGKHWDEELLRERKIKRRPTVTINALSATIRQGSNAERLHGTGIRIVPAGRAATREKAKLYNEIVRQIQRNSKAELAYDHARQFQRKMGRGFFTVRNRWADDDSMEQVIRIEWIDNPHSVFLDPHYKRQDYSDRLWGHVVEDYSLEDFKAAFPESAHDYDLSSFGAGMGHDWIAKDRVRVSEYYWVEQDVKTRIQLDNGEEVWADQLPKTKKRGKSEEVVIPEGRRELRRRHIKSSKVWRSLITSKEILEENELPCSTIPIFQLDGERRNLPGEGIDYRGQVRDAKEPARVRDFMESGILEAVVVARTAPWLVEVQQIAGLEREWDGQAVDNPAVLRYKAQGSAENPIPPPQRNLAGPDVQAFVQAATRAQNHERQVLGTPDVYQEETRREQSGTAIQARRSLQEQGVSHYAMNEGVALERCGQVLLEMIPRVYDAPRVMRITGEHRGDPEKDVVMYAGDDRAEDAMRVAEQNKGAVLFDVLDGRYEVNVEAGRNTDTDRQEAVDMIQEALRQSPDLAPIVLPILFKHSDWAGADDLQDALEQRDKVPPEAQDKMKQMEDFIGQLEQQMGQATEHIKGLEQQVADKDKDREAKMAIAAAQQETQRYRESASNETKLAVEEMKMLGAQASAEYNALQQRISQLVELFAASNPPTMQQQPTAPAAPAAPTGGPMSP